MSPSPRPESEPTETIRKLVAECLELLEEKDEAAVEALLREHSEHAELVRLRLSRLGEAGLLDSAAGDGGPLPERLGPFRLLRRIGAGGMGVVYLAEQEPLGRTVALKLVRPDLLYFDGARARFLREVEVVARLKHPGIVQVYTVGEQDGIPYFAMEFVEGGSLEAVLKTLRGRSPEKLSGRDLLRAVRSDEQPVTSEPGRSLEESSWVDACFRLVLQLAEVLEHAHARGVLHRDVKPSNVMLTPDGRALLLDFGLASTRGTTRLTRTGSQVGSLPYMAPELLRGREADERTDVYAFGVTLYELLTLRLPYLSSDPEETRRLILDGTPPPIRRENPSVPGDAATVCMTAMEPDRARRYASAAAFAADLRAILERRPIAARPPGPVLRLRRFSQRHPAQVVGLLLGLFLVAASVGFAVHQTRVSRRLAGLVEEKDGLVVDLTAANESKALALAEARRGFARSVRAANEMLREVAQGPLRDLPGAELAKRELLEEAAALYEELLAERPDDPDVRHESALGFAWLADVLAQVGETERAIATARRAVAMLARLREERPLDVGVLNGLALSHNLLAIALQGAGQLEERLRFFELAARDQAALYDLLADQGAGDDELRSSAVRRAGELGNVGVSLFANLQLDEARDVLMASRSLLRGCLSEEPGDERTLLLLSRCCCHLGGVLYNLGEYDLGREICEEGLVVVETLLFDSPVPDARLSAAGLYSFLGANRWRAGDRTGAVEATGECEALLRGLVADFAHTFEYRLRLVGTLVQKGSFECGTRPDDATLATLEEAVGLADELAEDFPDSPDAWFVKARAFSSLGDHCVCAGRHAEAEEALRLALELVEEICERWPERRSSVDRRADNASSLARTLLHLGRLDEARELAELGVELSRAELSAEIEIELGVRLGTLGDVALAQKDYERVRSVGRRLMDVDTNPPEYRRAAARNAACIPLLAADGTLDGARREELTEAFVGEALDLLERAVDRGGADAARLHGDPGLAPLRGNDRFRELVERLGAGR